MPINTRIDAFVEDRAHELLIGSVIRRIAEDVGLAIELRFISAVGGHPRVLNELSLFRKAVENGGRRRPDVLVVAIDGNCKGWTKARSDLSASIGDGLASDIVIACPDPHVERWFMSDPESFVSVVGYRPTIGKRKCQRDLYKRLLSDAVLKGGSPVLLGGIDFAPDLVKVMDLYRAGQNDRSFGHFVDQLRACFIRRAERIA